MRKKWKLIAYLAGYLILAVLLAAVQPITGDESPPDEGGRYLIPQYIYRHGALPEGLELMHETVSGRLRTLILRGRPEETLQKLAECQPLFLDAVPLSLEEIFIYELGGADYAVKDILL